MKELVDYSILLERIGTLDNDDALILSKLIKRAEFKSEILSCMTIQIRFLIEILMSESSKVESRTREKVHGVENIGFVYIAKQQNEPSVYKIGRTRHISNREACFSTGNAYIKIIYTLKSARYKKIERVLHKIYRHKKIKGEWFNLDDSDIQSLVKLFGFVAHIKD